MRAPHATTLLAVLFMLAGCSALSIKRPDPQGPGGVGDCTESYAAPAVDAALAAGLAAGGIYLFARPEDSCDECQPAAGFKKTIEVLIGVTAVTAAVAEGIVGYSGYRSVSTCRRLRLHDKACAAGGSLDCATPPPPAQPSASGPPR